MGGGTNPKSYPQAPPSAGSHEALTHQGQYPLPRHPRTKIREPEAALELLKLLKLANLKLFTYPASPVPSQENRNKDSYSHFPPTRSASLLTPVLPHVAHTGTVSTNHVSNSSHPPDVPASLYLNNIAAPTF